MMLLFIYFVSLKSSRHERQQEGKEKEGKRKEKKENKRKEKKRKAEAENIPMM
jgi:hypothetical protein